MIRVVSVTICIGQNSISLEISALINYTSCLFAEWLLPEKRARCFELINHDRWNRRNGLYQNTYHYDDLTA